MNRRDAVIAGLLAAVLVGWLVPFARLGVDFHHDGIMLKPALDVLSGQVLFRDTFMQYGALSCYLQVAALWMHPTLLSVRLLTVAAYGVSLFFLYASWRLILPRSLTILSCGLFILFIPAYEKNWLDQYWMLLPWSSAYALMFQCLGLYALFRVIRDEQAKHWGLILGAACAAAFWCRQPVGVIMFGSLVAIGFALQGTKWAPVHCAKRTIFGWVGVGFLAVNAAFLASILISDALPEWWIQNFVWPRRWVAGGISENWGRFVALFVHPAAGAGLLLVLAATAAPLIMQRFWPGLAARFRTAWWLSLTGVLGWQHERVLSWLSLREGGWTVVLPLVIALQAGRSIAQMFGGTGPAKTAEYFLVAALAAFSLGSLTQYYPLPDSWHTLWSLAPAFGLFVFVCWRTVGGPASVVALGLTAALLPSLLMKVHSAHGALTRPLVTLEHPAVLRGMRVRPEQARSLDQISATLGQVMRHQPDIPSVLFGDDAMFLCFTNNQTNPSPYFVTWTGLTNQAEDRQRWNYVARVRPLLFFHKARWDLVNAFYRRTRYVPLLYVEDEALEIAVPEELARTMGIGAYGMEPKNAAAKKPPTP